MSTYLASENAFLRAFGNRCLLLLVLCGLSRSGDAIGSTSVQGITLNISQGLIVVGGPLLALLFMISMKMEADNLELMRCLNTSEVKEQDRVRSKIAPYILFLFPTLTAIFFIVQFCTDLVPADAACPAFNRLRYWYDFSLQHGFPSKFCIRDITEHMPWIYPPLQLFIYLGIAVASTWFSWATAQGWRRCR